MREKSFPDNALPISSNLRGAIFMSISMVGFTANDTMTKTVSASMNMGQVMLLRGLFATVLIVLLAWSQGALRNPRQAAASARRAALGQRSAGHDHLPGRACPASRSPPPRRCCRRCRSPSRWAPRSLSARKCRWRRWAAIAVGFTGVLIIVRPGNEGFNAYALWALASVGFCTVRDLATKRMPESIPSLLVSTVTAALVTVCGAFLVGPMGGWSPVSVQSLGLLATAAVLLLIGYQCHHHGDAHRRDLLRRAVPLHRAAVGDPARLPGFRRRARRPDDRRRRHRRRLRPLHALPRAGGRARPPGSRQHRRRPWRPTGFRPLPTRTASSSSLRPSCWPAAVRRAWAAATRASSCSAASRCSRTCSTGLAPQAGAIAISANGDPARFAEFGLPVLPDTVPGYLGPLAGLLAGMQWAARPRRDPYSEHADRHAILSGTTSAPRSAEACSGRRTGACRLRRPAPSGRRPVAGRRSPAGSHDFLLSGATYKVSAFADACDAVVVDFPMIALAGRSRRSVLQRQQPGRPRPRRDACLASCER